MKHQKLLKISNSLLNEKVLHYANTYPTIEKGFEKYIKKGVFGRNLTKTTPKNEKMPRFTAAFS